MAKPPALSHRTWNHLPVFLLFILIVGSGFCLPPKADPTSPSAGDDPGKDQTPPSPSSFVQREEVRFVTLDLVVEEHAKGGWRRARDLTQDQVLLRVGGEKVLLDSFENGCSLSGPLAPETGAPIRAQGGAPDSGAHAEGPSGKESVRDTPPNAEGKQQASPVPPPQRYVLYFDLEHLKLGSRTRAFEAALRWARKAAQSPDEAMIITGGMSLRIVRPMLPVSQRLVEDLRAARKDFSTQDLWAEGESGRFREIRSRRTREEKIALSKSYASIEQSVATRVLENFRDVMAIFDSIEGTKNLLFFSETLRMVPGSQYFGNPSELRAGFSSLDDAPEAGTFLDVSGTLRQVVEQANERNVRLYTIQASGLGAGEDTQDTLTMLASETGGVSVHGTNDLATLFDRAREDASCFYRIGFRMPASHTGKVLPVTLRIGRDGTGYRLRYRRTLMDPTQEQQEKTRLQAAFLAPQAARAFPMTVTSTRLFDHPRGSRIRVQVDIPLKDLLALPGPRPGGQRLTLLVGGQVLPIREETVPQGISRENPWMDVDPKRESRSFGRRLEINLPPAAGPRRATRVAYTGEMDASPGHYLIVAVAEDVLAGTVSSRTIEFRARASFASLGEIGLAAEDAGAIVVSEPDTPATPASLSPKLLTADLGPISPDRRPSFFYALCLPETNPSKPQVGSEVGKAQDGWALRRSLACGSGPAVPLPSRSLPEIRKPGGCTLVFDPLPSDRVPAGRCRFEVRLEIPGDPPETRTREFEIVSSSVPPGH